MKKTSKAVLSFLICAAMLISSACIIPAFAGDEQLTPYCKGDVNGSASIDAADARLILRHATGIELLHGPALEAADLYNNGNITAAVARLILRVATGLESMPQHPEEPQPPDFPDIPPSGELKGKFYFSTYGYGHGVGMSQYGANGMALTGSSFEEILLNYYPGTTIADAEIPETINIRYSDSTLTPMNANELVARITEKEMGGSFEPEAIKAQVVAVFTYILYNNLSNPGTPFISSSSVAIDYGTVSANVQAAVDAMLGKAILFNDRPILSVWFSCSAGKTTASQNVWTEEIPYLQGSDSHWDLMGSINPVSASFQGKQTIFTSDELKAVLTERYPGIQLSENPAEWLEIIEHDKAVDDELGYVKSIRVGNINLKGNQFRTTLNSVKTFRSPCFTFAYVPDAV
ncbi:MAG: hypothetical protein GX051_00975 [Clostridiales bacterium]|nr:hypothetical protein [Clostridiales bacterium]